MGFINNMSYFIKGLIKVILILCSFITIPLVIIDLVSMMGGKEDNFITGKIFKFFEKLLD